MLGTYRIPVPRSIQCFSGPYGTLALYIVNIVRKFFALQGHRLTPTLIQRLPELVGNHRPQGVDRRGVPGQVLFDPSVSKQPISTLSDGAPTYPTKLALDRIQRLPNRLFLLCVCTPCARLYPELDVAQQVRDAIPHVARSHAQLAFRDEGSAVTPDVKNAAQTQEGKRPVGSSVAVLPVHGVAGAKDAQVAIRDLVPVNMAEVGGDDGVAGGDDVLLKSGHEIVRAKGARYVQYGGSRIVGKKEWLDLLEILALDQVPRVR